MGQGVRSIVMSNGIVLNHHSLPFSSQEEVEEGLLVFFKIINKCRQAGLKILLIDEDQDKSLMGLELARGYFVRDWFALASKNAELTDWRRLLRSLETKQPLFEVTDLESIGETVDVGLLGSSSGKPVLLAAFYYETFLISFKAMSTWAKSHIDVWVLNIEKDPDLIEDIVLNLSSEVCLETHKEELERRRNELLNSARDIWLQRADLFPNLTLLPDLGSALQSWSARRDILLKSRDALNILQLFCEKWVEGVYADYQHNYLKDLGLAAEVSGESSSVYKDPDKRSERMFWLDNAQLVYCENHVKLPSGFRMHFYSDQIEKRIYVAYLGPHMTL